MKSIVSLAILGFLALSQNSVMAAGPGVNCSALNNSTSVVFTFSPTPLEFLSSLGSQAKSPAAILQLLDSNLNPVKVLSQTFQATLQTLFAAIPRIPFLPRLPIPTCSFTWSSNQLFCQNVPESVTKSLCQTFTAISNITAPISFPLPQPQEATLACENDQPWGLAKIRAQEAWAAGFEGEGITVANVDSGVLGTHDELRDRRRATYYWFDAYNQTNTVPTDDAGHGTHTMGSVCGKTVGVARKATWIACKGCVKTTGDATTCGELQLRKCMEWMYCPDKNQNGLNCTTRPNVINHSWGGGVGDTKFNDILRLMKAANIFNFFSSGNSGPTCSSVVSPADGNGTDLGIVSVGATACNDNIGSYSSTGPSQAADNMFQLGVELVAPGSNILSAWIGSDSATAVKTGTSMSSPHAAGAAAVLLSQNRALTFDQMRDTFRNTAYRNPGVTSSQCFSSKAWPNNVYGYGRIDLANACGLGPPADVNATTNTTTQSTTA